MDRCFLLESISNGAQYVTPNSTFNAKKSKCPGLAEEIGFSAPNSCNLEWLVEGVTQLCTSTKECNKLNLTAAAHYF
jgi:hypothetical protein